MKVMDEDTKFAHLGKPGSAFSKGFQRRLSKVQEQIDLTDKVILDQGCGVGVWLEQFSQFTDPRNVFGFDVDQESIDTIRTSELLQIPSENVLVCPGEKLTFEDNKFDVVFSNEVLEHVHDDFKSIQETLRVLKPGGTFIIFTPNRGWPFETHGMFIGKKYYWGNIPLLPWMPQFIYKKFAPHVRNYSNGSIRKLLKNAGFTIEHHTHVFPGFDGAVRRWGILGRSIQLFFHALEKTPLHFFGISHFIIARKLDTSRDE